MRNNMNVLKKIAAAFVWLALKVLLGLSVSGFYLGLKDNNSITRALFSMAVCLIKPIQKLQSTGKDLAPDWIW